MHGVAVSGLWSQPRGAKQEEFRHVRVERYREFVPDRGGVFDVVRHPAAAKGGNATVDALRRRIGTVPVALKRPRFRGLFTSAVTSADQCQ